VSYRPHAEEEGGRLLLRLTRVPWLGCGWARRSTTVGAGAYHSGMADPVEPSSSGIADPQLRAARERIQEREQQLRLTRHQAELKGKACDSWREAAEATASVHAEALAELHRLKAEAP
jgi:hypothetical protein